MRQDHPNAEDGRRRFVREAVDKGGVWGLAGLSGRIVFDSDEHPGVAVVVFWSNREDALRAAVREPALLAPNPLQPIPLRYLLEDWLLALQDGGELAGLNWETDNSGVVVRPADLAEEIRAARRLAWGIATASTADVNPPEETG